MKALTFTWATQIVCDSAQSEVELILADVSHLVSENFFTHPTHMVLTQKPSLLLYSFINMSV